MKPAIRNKVYGCLANVYWVISKTWCQVIVMGCSGNLFVNFSVSENRPLRILLFQNGSGEDMYVYAYVCVKYD